MMPDQNPLSPIIYAVGGVVTAALLYKVFLLVLARV